MGRREQVTLIFGSLKRGVFPTVVWPTNPGIIHPAWIEPDWVHIDEWVILSVSIVDSTHLGLVELLLTSELCVATVR